MKHTQPTISYGKALMNCLISVRDWGKPVLLKSNY